MGNKNKRALARPGAEGSANSQSITTQPEYSSIPEAVFLGPYTPKRLKKLIDEFNKRYAVVTENGKCLIFRQAWDHVLSRIIIERLSFADLKQMYSNRLITVSFGDQEITKSAANWWLDSPFRRQFLGGTIFDPSSNSPSDCWNLWRGFAITPRAGDWTLMKAHLLDVICSGDKRCFDYLINWLARLFQHPELQGEVAVVLRGGKGCGKGTLGNWLLRAWGQHGLHITNGKHLTGGFNGHLRDAVFLFADESFAVTDPQQEAVLKGLITEPEILIEAKYKNPVLVRNMTHLLMASNSDWVVPASTVERRFFVLNVSETRIGDKEYFEALHEQMANGGLEAMTFDLLAVDISDFNHRVVPPTSALDEQKKLSFNPIQKWWTAILERGFVWRSRFGDSYFAEWHENAATELLLNSYMQWATDMHVPERYTHEQIGKFMTEVYPPKRPSGDCVIGEVNAIEPNGNGVKILKDRATGYFLGTLVDARSKFAENVGLKFNWAETASADGNAE